MSWGSDVRRQWYADPQRLGRTRQLGIAVEAMRPDGGIGAVDITELDRESMIRWMICEGRPYNRRACNLALLLLGHEPQVGGPGSEPAGDVGSVGW